MTQTFTIIAAILSIYLCNCRPSESSSRTLYVTAKSGLILRERPEQNAPTIAILPYAVPVQVSSITEHESVIEGVRAKWIEISFHGKPAYAFSGFLSSTQPSVVVLLSYSPSKTRRFVLENSGPATLTECQNHYSATCVLKVFDGDKLIYERQGDAAVRWISDQTILLRRDLGDAGYVGSSISLLNVSTGNASPFCSFGSYTPIGVETPEFQVEYSICGKSEDCEGFRVNLKGVVQHTKTLKNVSQPLDSFPAEQPKVDFNGNQCWFLSGARRFSKP